MSIAKRVLEELALNIKADLAHADKHAADLATWKDSAPRGQHEANSAAMLLHHLYTAIEAIVERSLKTLDGASPRGEDWHIQLLELASASVEGVRDAILPKDAAVDELRRFRHRFRKRYDAVVELTLLRPVIATAVEAWPRIRAHLAKFSAFVDACAAAAK